MRGTVLPFVGNVKQTNSLLVQFVIPPTAETVSKLMNATRERTEPGAKRLHARERTLGSLLETKYRSLACSRSAPGSVVPLPDFHF